MKKAVIAVILVLFSLTIASGVFAEDWSFNSEDYYNYNTSSYVVDGIDLSNTGPNGNIGVNGALLSSTGWSSVNSYSNAQYTTGNISMLVSAADLYLKSNVSYTGIAMSSVYCTASDCGFGWYIMYNSGTSQTHKFDNSGGKLRACGYESDNSSWSCQFCADPLPTNTWFNTSFEYNGSDKVVLSYNGAPCLTFNNKHHEIDRLNFYNGDTSSYYLDNVWMSNNAPRPQIPGTTPPAFLNMNCTSCDVPYGDSNPPYETGDTTPTFSFETDKNTWCRIGDDDLGYDDLGAERDCNSGEGGMGPHICTLDVEDELKLTTTDYAYISCRDVDNNSNTTTLEMRITGIQCNASYAIEKGIAISIPSAEIYTSQKVYVRTTNDNQALATFDKVAIYGSQRWAFNYISENESSIQPFYNLTPVFYFLELFNISSLNLINTVSGFINSTKT